MLRRAAVPALLLATGALGADLAGRGALARALVDLAGAAPSAPRAPSPASSPAPSAPPRLTSVEAARFSAVASVAGACASGCTVTVAVQPSPGRRINVDAPNAFVPGRAEGVEAGRDRLRARGSTADRAVVLVPLVADGPGRALEGDLRVVTCDEEACVIDRAPISIPLG